MKYRHIEWLRIDLLLSGRSGEVYVQVGSVTMIAGISDLHFHVRPCSAAGIDICLYNSVIYNLVLLLSSVM